MNIIKYKTLVSLHLFPLATLSISSFLLIAKELAEPLAALIISSAKHSLTVLIDLNALFLAPIAINDNAWLTLLRGETSTACLL